MFYRYLYNRNGGDGLRSGQTRQNDSSDPSHQHYLLGVVLRQQLDHIKGREPDNF